MAPPPRLIKDQDLSQPRNKNKTKSTFGVIMSLRLGCIVGQACLCYTFLIILLSCIVTTLTTLSMAAIATNDQRTGGACSCMLGPVGGSETIVLQVGRITNDPLNDIRLYGSLLITILLEINGYKTVLNVHAQFDDPVLLDGTCSHEIHLIVTIHTQGTHYFDPLDRLISAVARNKYVEWKQSASRVNAFDSFCSDYERNAIWVRY
eukprot:969239_1